MTDRPAMDSSDLRQLAEAISGRITIHCPRCNNWQRLTLELRELRFGSSPDLSAIDPHQPSRPRLQFYCGFCRRVIGFVQGDEWSPGATIADPSGRCGEPPAGVTRWDRLELDEHDSGD